MSNLAETGNEAPLRALSAHIRELLGSELPDRFVKAFEVARVAVQFQKATSVRVEDFQTSEPETPIVLPRKHRHHEPSVLVPDKLGDTERSVLSGITQTIVEVLEKPSRRRFAETERLCETAMSFLKALAPPVEKPKPQRRGGVHVPPMDPLTMYEQGFGEGMYVRPEPLDDIDQTQRDLLATTTSALVNQREESVARVAANEMRELRDLEAMIDRFKEPVGREDKDRFDVLWKRRRILTENIRKRTQEKKDDEMVPSNQPRGHSTGARQRAPHEDHRAPIDTVGDECSPQAS